jgi:hypothetical protein
MDEKQFWAILDEAWQSDKKLAKFRDAVLKTLESEEAKESFEEKYGDGDPMIPGEEKLIQAIQARLDKLSAPELHQFDVILERKLYDIDRQELQEQTDGSDDGFLYCRGFIVAIGQKYYDAVNRTPSLAMIDWACEEMTYVSWHLYNDKFGDMPRSGISRETGSNAKGWSE